MSKYFSVTRFVLLLVLASIVAHADSRRGSGFATWCLAYIYFFIFDPLSRLVAYRRLCSRLGIAHRVWVNADRFENLPFLRWSKFPTWALHFWWKPSSLLLLWRGLSNSLRSWWVWQCVYEVMIAMVVVVGVPYFLDPILATWSNLPFALAAVVILASKRAFAIYNPEKYFA